MSLRKNEDQVLRRPACDLRSQTLAACRTRWCANSKTWRAYTIACSLKADDPPGWVGVLLREIEMPWHLNDGELWGCYSQDCFAPVTEKEVAEIMRRAGVVATRVASRATEIITQKSSSRAILPRGGREL